MSACDLHEHANLLSKGSMSAGTWSARVLEKLQGVLALGAD